MNISHLLPPERRSANRTPLDRTPLDRTVAWLTWLGMAVATGALILAALLLHDARREAWQHAKDDCSNLSLALERIIAKEFADLDLGVSSAQAALARPAIQALDPTMQRLLIFGPDALPEVLGRIVVIDSTGRVVMRSGAEPGAVPNLGERDYVRIHQLRADAGLYISAPHASRFWRDTSSLAVSRRRETNGQFSGVIAGIVQLEYLQGLFASLDLGPHGSVALIRSDGRLITRYPPNPGDADRDLSVTSFHRKLVSAPEGQFVTSATVDHVQRLYTFRHVAGLPLIVTVGREVADIYAGWWRKTLLIGATLCLLCAATLTLCVLFRREIRRRMAVEQALLAAGAQLATVADTDGLTGLSNRRRLEATLRHEWQRALEDGSELGLLMLDADDFKRYNDTNGHPAGDLVLQALAACIRRNASRPRDLAARYGGEEFVVLLPQTNLAGALQIAEAIRAAMQALGMPHGAHPGSPVTVSVGVAASRPLHPDGDVALVKAADEALYAAKRAGRNRVSAAPQPQRLTDAAA